MNDVFTAVFPAGEGVTAYRYHSGLQVLDEALIGGRLIARYRNCTGQVMPETHLSAERLGAMADGYPEASAFRLSVNGQALDSGWAFESFDKRAEGHTFICALTLLHSAALLRVTVYTKLDGSDFILRWLSIENAGNKSAALTNVMPYGGQIWLHRLYNGRQPNYRRGEQIPSGSSYAVAYNHMKNGLDEGDFYFDNLTPGDFCIYSDYGRSGWSRPACWLRDRLNGETFVCEYAWSGNWRIAAQMTADAYDRLTFEIGMLPANGEALRVLAPGERAETPVVHFGLFRDTDDVIVQKTHSHVRLSVLPPLPAGAPVSEIEANHRGYLCDRETEEGIKRDIDVAEITEAEMYVVDAGWYGVKEPNEWWNNVGDWQAGPWLKNGFEPIPEYAHKKGMRFGLWVEIEAAGAKSALRGEHPGWIMTRHGTPCAGGRALDLANPEVEAFCLDTICRLVKQYKLDMYRIDHNHVIGLGGTRIVDGYTENTLWRYYEAFYRIFNAVRERHPALTLQNCAGGGGRLDWGTMSVFHNTELSDWMRQPRSTRILAGVMMSLPPEILLRTFGTEVPEMHMDGDLDAQLRICMMCLPIYRGIAPSVEELAPALKDKIVRCNRLYKEVLRPIMKDCDVYHHTPFQPVMNACPHTILEYGKKDKSAAVIAVFAQSPDCGGVLVKPRGLSMEREYRVIFDNSGESVLMSGYALIRDGLLADVKVSMSSELIIIAEARE